VTYAGSMRPAGWGWAGKPTFHQVIAAAGRWRLLILLTQERYFIVPAGQRGSGHHSRQGQTAASAARGQNIKGQTVDSVHPSLVYRCAHPRCGRAVSPSLYRPKDLQVIRGHQATVKYAP